MAQCPQRAHREESRHLLMDEGDRKEKLSGFGDVKENLAYWLSCSPEERIAAVGHLRRQAHESETRLQRVARVIKRPER